jgi:endogenous inhibitor of DNA gyrase (YacG/DUF329 family)
MPRKKTSSLRCPICRTLVTRSGEDFPFCSDRCRTIDLGKWASGKYVISTAINDPEELESVMEEQERKRSGDDFSSDKH